MLRIVKAKKTFVHSGLIPPLVVKTAGLRENSSKYPDKNRHQHLLRCCLASLVDNEKNAIHSQLQAVIFCVFSLE